MRSVVIVSYGRTPFSRARPKEPAKDPYGELPAEDLLAHVVPVVLERAALGPADVDHFYLGCALGVGEQWTFGGRTSALRAGLDVAVPTQFIDMQCGSGMAAIHSAFLEIAGGQADVALAGGMEQMTRVPVGPELFRKGFMTVSPDVYRKTADWDMITGLNMGLTAERLAERCGHTREQLDAYAVLSHQRAARAYREEFFRDELVEVVAGIDVDQSLRPATRTADLAALQTVFKEDGVITAGNSSPLNAGAAAMLLMAEETARQRGLQPLARITATGSAGVRPELMGSGPVPAVRKALARAGQSPADIDLWEINEAFSTVVLHAAEELAIPEERLNVHGGALALGHPLGATGVRLVGTLARSLRTGDRRTGCAAACVGGGQGIATLIEVC